MLLEGGPKGLQEEPKNAPGGLPESPKTAPRGIHGAQCRSLRMELEPVGSQRLLRPSWSHLGAVLGPS
eukprot:7940574-Pyramimonas_sp.AAC.1